MKQLLDRLVRAHHGTLVARLTGLFGPANLGLAEAIVHDAYLTALNTWDKEGVPENPLAWLTAVAKNRAFDQLRRARFETPSELDETVPAPELEQRAAHLRGEIADDELRMIFVACHPTLPPESRVALTLRTLCGLESAEIARALLVQESAIEKRLVRARKQLREEQISFELPGETELAARLDVVLKVLYLVFGEGYSAARGEQQIREELCREAIRLTALLLEHPATRVSRVYALFALMLLQASRLSARLDAEGNLLTLAEQDRNKWDRMMIGRGLEALALSAEGEEISEYHLEAGIAACHAVATRFEATDWPRIVGYYDRLLELYASPIVRLNRAIAIGYAEGPERAIKELSSLERDPRLQEYGLLRAATADLLEKSGDTVRAKKAYKRALELCATEPERRFVQKRLAELG